MIILNYIKLQGQSEIHETLSPTQGRKIWEKKIKKILFKKTMYIGNLLKTTNNIITGDCCLKKESSTLNIN